jgi:predicted RNA-binding Zn ribbon-like protein
MAKAHDHPKTDHQHPKAAPAELDHVREFVNTLDLETHEELLDGPDGLASWLEFHDLLPVGEPALTDADVRQATSMREALRKLLLAHNGAPLDPAAVDAVNAAAKSAELVVRFDVHGHAALVPVRPGIDGALGRLLAIVYAAMENGTWERLKACPAEDCEWAFYDWSKNRSGTWCDMAECGNRAKARAYRERRQRGSEAKTA